MSHNKEVDDFEAAIDFALKVQMEKTEEIKRIALVCKKLRSVLADEHPELKRMTGYDAHANAAKMSGIVFERLIRDLK